MEQQQNNYDWSIPQRQSPAAIYVMLLQTAGILLKSLWPVMLVIFFKNKTDKDGIIILWIALVFGVLTLFVTIINFLFYKIHIENDKLVINSGWLKKKSISLPLSNIQSVHLEQNIIQRILQVAKVSFDSSGSEKVEIKIDALSLKKATNLQGLLSQHSPLQTTGETAVLRINDHVHRLGLPGLLKLSLSANHLEAFFIVFAISLNLINDARKYFDIDGWQLIGDFAQRLTGRTTLLVTMLIILGALVSVIASTVRTVIKFYDFKLIETAQGWKISFGLFTKKEKLLPLRKIQVLSWKANWLRRKIDFWILTVQSIGHNDAKRTPHVQVPVTSLQSILALAATYQQTPVFELAAGNKIQPGYWKSKTLMVGLPVTILLSAAFYWWIGFAGFWMILLGVYFAGYFYTWYNNCRWFVNEEGLQLYVGVWGRKQTLLTWKKIQQVQLTQSAYQRSHKLATVLMKTAGGNVKLPFITFDEAVCLVNLSLYYVESRNDNWM